MPPKLTEEQRIESDKKKAEYMKAWRIRNKEKFDTYMQGYYLEHKKKINDRRAVNSKLQRRRAKIVITGTLTENVENV
jgi:CRISPR/Cas system-associated exonuclease Cas4 (RecB family)